MDNIKVLIATIDFLVHNLQSYSFDGTLHREALVGALRDCKAALAPLAEPVEIPEEPEPHDDDAIYIDRLCMYASELRSALERALAASESAFNRGLKAGNEQSVMQQTALIAATARAGASEKDAKLLNGFEKSHQSVYYTTNDWRGVEESGWAYWEEFGPEGPHLYPDIRAAMQAALDAAGRSGG